MASAALFPLPEACDIDEGPLCICISERLPYKAIAKFDRFYADFKTCVREQATASPAPAPFPKKSEGTAFQQFPLFFRSFGCERYRSPALIARSLP